MRPVLVLLSIVVAATTVMPASASAPGDVPYVGPMLYGFVTLRQDPSGRIDRVFAGTSVPCPSLAFPTGVEVVVRHPHSTASRFTARRTTTVVVERARERVTVVVSGRRATLHGAPVWRGRVALKVRRPDSGPRPCRRARSFVATRPSVPSVRLLLIGRREDTGATVTTDIRTPDMIVTADGTRREVRLTVFSAAHVADGWSADFAAPRGAALVAGRHYRNAGEPDPAGPRRRPGLDVADSTICDTVTGSFTVRRARYDSRGRILDFAASYVEHCFGQPPLVIRGRVSFRRIYLSARG